MKVLITGSEGFLGKNLTAELRNNKQLEILECNKRTKADVFHEYCKNCDFVFHFAGVNRTKTEEEFIEGNLGITKDLTRQLQLNHNTSPIVFASSIQAKLENPYGNSKRMAEQHLIEYQKSTGVKIMIYRFPNVFGKWCKPNYHSVIATFCYNISRELPIEIHTPDKNLEVVYIDDVVKEMVRALSMNPTSNNQSEQLDQTMIQYYYKVPITYQKKLSEIVSLLYQFKREREQCFIPEITDTFIKKLYSTYLSYLPVTSLKYEISSNFDKRGSFAEFVKLPNHSQVSINITKPDMTKGDHWHQSKHEKFLVVSGIGKVLLRKVGSSEILEYEVSGNKLEIMDIPAGYIHNITNTGDIDLVTIIWADEVYDQNKPDTYHITVEELADSSEANNLTHL